MLVTEDKILYYLKKGSEVLKKLNEDDRKAFSLFNVDENGLCYTDGEKISSGITIGSTEEEKIGLLLMQCSSLFLIEEMTVKKKGAAESFNNSDNNLKSIFPFVKNLCSFSNIEIATMPSIFYEGKTYSSKVILLNEDDIKKLSKLKCRIFVNSLSLAGEGRVLMRFCSRGKIAIDR